jgi:glycosidase
MRKSYTLVITSLFILALLSCSKEDNETPVGDEGNVYVPVPLESVPANGDVVMYEVNLRAFPGGNLQGVRSKLDHIASLGTNVIWLMPIYPIGTVKSVNSPYCVRDYTAVGAEYGTLADLRALTDAAHTKGMAVILDWVANHTAWDHPWVNMHPDWYTQDQGGNIIHPPGTNWEDVADLNYDNSQMREAMITEMSYWITQANIDGFRCDYADGVPEDFWREAITTLETRYNKDLILFAEGEREDHFQAGFDFTFGWSWYGKLQDVYSGTSVAQLFLNHNQTYAQIPEGKHRIRFTTNHDESAWNATPVSIFNGQDGALAAFATTLFTGGAPLIYGSQEVGTENTVPFFSQSTIAWNNNPDILSKYRELMEVYSSFSCSRTGENTIYNHPDIACFTKTSATEELLLIINLRDRNINYTPPSALRAHSHINPVSGEPFALPESVSLAPYTYEIRLRFL